MAYNFGTTEETAMLTRFDFESINCDDPIFSVPDFVEEALCDWDERTDYGEIFHD